MYHLHISSIKRHTQLIEFILRNVIFEHNRHIVHFLFEVRIKQRIQVRVDFDDLMHELHVNIFYAIHSYLTPIPTARFGYEVNLKFRQTSSKQYEFYR